MLKYLLYLLLFCGFSLFVSCKKDKLKAKTASFMVANSVSVKTNAFQGSNSHKITDLWYYVNQEFKGVFPVGSSMPIVAEDNAEITIYPGIKNNGISATRIPYPFYAPITFTQSLVAGQTYSINPQFDYLGGLIFVYNDNLDGGASYFNPAGDSSYVILADPTKTMDGSAGCVFMGMSDAKPTAKMLQSSSFHLPTGGAAVYLELNYKCNQYVTVGVIAGGTEERQALTLGPTDVWNKIYISLTSVVSNQPTYPGYQVYIKGQKQVANPKIYIDNVKLITQ
jgi:hypothetical protein